MATAPTAAHQIGFWDGVRRVLPSVRAAMEYCWLYPWIAVIGGGLYGGTEPLIDAGWTFLLLVLGQAAVKPALDRGGPLRRSRVLLVGVGLVLGLLAVHGQHYRDLPFWQPAWIGALLRSAHDTLPAVPRPVMGALVAACLWWRGLVLGTREVGAMEIEVAYKTGVGMIVAYFLAAAIYGDTAGFQAAGPTLPGSLPAFFFMGLSALALARLATIWDVGRPDERAQFPARAWVLLIVGLVGIILLMASMTAGLAAADVATYMGLALRPLLPVIEVLFTILFIVASVLVRALIFVLERIPRRTRIPLPQDTSTPLDDLLRRLRELHVAPQVIEGARWGMVLAVLLALAIGMAMTIVLLRRRQRSPDEDEHESVWSARELLRGLRHMLPRLRLRRARGVEPSLPATAVRLVYRELLRLGAALGAPRPLWATPREHDPRLRSVLAQASDEVALLTGAYERVRYGTWEPTAAEVQDAREALERVRKTLPPEPPGAGRAAGAQSS
jgi:hypothetical protein